jgi:hypothetical protein
MFASSKSKASKKCLPIVNNNGYLKNTICIIEMISRYRLDNGEKDRKKMKNGIP